MPRITKVDMKESIVSFANDAILIINENLNLDDLINKEYIPTIESNGWYYSVNKSVANIQPEILIRRQNYKQGNTQYYKDQPKGNRINEQAFIYKEGMNCEYNKDNGFIIDGYSIQNYIKKAF